MQTYVRTHTQTQLLTVSLPCIPSRWIRDLAVSTDHRERSFSNQWMKDNEVAHINILCYIIHDTSHEWVVYLQLTGWCASCNVLISHTHTHIGWRLGKCIWAQDHLVSIGLSQTTLNIGQTAKRFFSTAKISSWPKSSSLPKPSREKRNICLYSFRITAHISYQIKMCISFRYLLYIQAFFNS